MLTLLTHANLRVCVCVSIYQLCVCVELKGLGSDFVFGFVQSMDGERDPRNLLLSFQIAGNIIAHGYEMGENLSSPLLSVTPPLLYSPLLSHSPSPLLSLLSFLSSPPSLSLTHSSPPLSLFVDIWAYLGYEDIFNLCQLDPLTAVSSLYVFLSFSLCLCLSLSLSLSGCVFLLVILALSSRQSGFI